nr:MAG TPA: hypothetical protein [Caudoviricetes sp.]
MVLKNAPKDVLIIVAFIAPRKGSESMLASRLTACIFQSTLPVQEATASIATCDYYYTIYCTITICISILVSYFRSKNWCECFSNIMSA